MRALIGDSHWQTDGEWKEAVLRVVLNRHLPQTLEAARGFVVTAGGNSGQVDVLIYDRTKPVLFRDGDLVIVTPDAVRGVVEVKTSLDGVGGFRDAVDKLGRRAHTIRSGDGAPADLFVGLFAYDFRNPNAHQVLPALAAVCQGPTRIVNHLCVGDDLFAKFWEHDPARNPGGHERPYDRWHLYRPQDMAAGYFVNNLLLNLAGPSVAQNRYAYFPEQSKEVVKIADHPFRAS